MAKTEKQKAMTDNIDELALEKYPVQMDTITTTDGDTITYDYNEHLRDAFKAGYKVKQSPAENKNIDELFLQYGGEHYRGHELECTVAKTFFERGYNAKSNEYLHSIGEKKIPLPAKQSQEQVGEWQLCPKCGGEGRLYGVVPNYESTHVIMNPTCDVCNGYKIIPKPVIPFPIEGSITIPCNENSAVSIINV